MPPPFARPSKWRLRRWWGRFPRWSRALAVLVVAAAFAAGGYYWFVTRANAVRVREVAAGWTAFEKAARALDDAGMKQALADLAALHPDDPLVRRRRQALDEGDADPTDASMCAVTVLRHVRDNRWADAEREADKRLAHEPDDWVCRCAKVAAALERKDRAAANKRLDALPDPAGKRVGASPAGVLFAAELFRAAGRDPAPVRSFLRGVIVGRLRDLAADADPPAVTVLLLKCYLEAFHPTDPNPQSLALAVADIGRLIESATKTAADAGDVPTLVQLGLTCDRLFAAFDRLKRDRAMTDEQFASVVKDHHERTRAVWQAVRDRDPKEAKAYHGLALAHLRTGDVAKATETAIAGLTAADDDPSLHALLTRLLQGLKRPDLAYAVVATAADREPDNVPLQLLAAEAAVAAGRQDLALAACGRVYRTQPKNPFAARLEAAAYLRAGDPHLALQTLAERIGEDRLVGDPEAARWYVRSRLEAGLGGLEPFLKKCEDAAVQKQNPALIAAVLNGILDAPFDAEWSATAVRTAARWLDRWPDDLALLRARADLLAHAAERIAPPWNETRLRPAVDACADVLRKHPDDTPAAAALAWLRLKGEKNVARAVDAAAPLMAADRRGDPLTPRQLEVLGAVYLADGQLDSAVRVLELVVRYAPTPSARFHLIQGYLKRGRTDDARAAFTAARAAKIRPWTEQEDADYRRTYEALQRENR